MNPASMDNPTSAENTNSPGRQPRQMGNNSGLAELGKVLHERLLVERSGCVLDEITERFRPLLVSALNRRFPKLRDPHLVETVANDALMAYFEEPERFDPNRGSLINYLYIDARGNLLDQLKRQRRFIGIDPSVIERELAATGAAEEPARRLLDEESPLIRQMNAVVSDATDRELVSMMMDGERDTAAFAEVLGIQNIPPLEQAVQVKRHKDRLKATLRRGIRRRPFVVVIGLLASLRERARAAAHRSVAIAVAVAVLTMFLGAYLWWRNTHELPFLRDGSTVVGVPSPAPNLLAPTRARLRQGVAEGWAAEKIFFASDRGVAPGEPQRYIWMMNPDGTDLEQVTFGDVNDVSPAVSPDGTELVFSRAESPINSNRGDCRTIWVKDLITGSETSTTKDRDYPAGLYGSAQPTWSPDGAAIAFHRIMVNPNCAGGVPETTSIWVVDYLPAIGIPKEVTAPTSLHPSWSPDNKYLIYMREMGLDGMFAICRIDLERGIEEEVIPFIRRPVAGHSGADYFPTCSPDGSKIAWTAYRHSRRGDVYVADSSDPLNTQLRVTPPSPLHWSSPAWSPDGSKLVFYSTIEQPEWPNPDRRPVAQHIWTSSADGSELTQLTSGPVVDSLPSWAIVVLPHADLAIRNTGPAGEAGLRISHTITVTTNGPTAARDGSVTSILDFINEVIWVWANSSPSALPDDVVFPPAHRREAIIRRLAK